MDNKITMELGFESKLIKLIFKLKLLLFKDLSTLKSNKAHILHIYDNNTIYYQYPVYTIHNIKNKHILDKLNKQVKNEKPPSTINPVTKFLSLRPRAERTYIQLPQKLI